MKWLLFIGALCILLLLSGCPQGTESFEKQMYDFAGSTLEGRLANTVHDSFEKTDNCTVQGCRLVFSLLGSYVPDVKLPESDEEVKEIVEKTKECKPRVNREIVEISEGLYGIHYSMQFSDACELEEFVEHARNYRVVIEINIMEGTAEVKEGKLDEESAETAKTVMPLLPLTGNCLAPVAAVIGFQFISPI